MTERPMPAGERLRALIEGYRVTQMISVAAALGLPDLLAGGGRSVAELASQTGTHEQALFRLLRALTPIGIVRRARAADGVVRFELAELGLLLRNDTAGSLAGWAEFVGRPLHWEAWGDLLNTVRTGQDAFGSRYGESVWSVRERNPEDGRLFDRAMSSLSSAVASRLAQTYDFGRFALLADLGGGDGTLLSIVLARYPAMRGVLFDQPHVVSGNRLRASGVADRCDIVGGSFFAKVPDGCDAYVLKSILHDWDDAHSARILQSVREVCKPAATLLIVERVLSEDDPTLLGALSDLNMMVSTGGAERTASEWRAVVEAGGFEMTGTTDIGYGWSVIEARPA